MQTRRCKERNSVYLHYYALYSIALMCETRCHFMHEAKKELFTVFSCSQVGAMEFCQLSPRFPLGASYLSSVQSWLCTSKVIFGEYGHTELKIIAIHLKASFSRQACFCVGIFRIVSQ